MRCSTITVKSCVCFSLHVTLLKNFLPGLRLWHVAYTYLALGHCCFDGGGISHVQCKITPNRNRNVRVCGHGKLHHESMNKQQTNIKSVHSASAYESSNVEGRWVCEWVVPRKGNGWQASKKWAGRLGTHTHSTPTQSTHVWCVFMCCSCGRLTYDEADASSQRSGDRRK